MMNKPPPFKALNIRIPNIIPIKERGFISHESGLVWGGGFCLKQIGILL